MTQILLKVNLIKPEHLLSILNQINNTQLTMEKDQARLSFFRYYVKKVVKKIWMDTCNS